MTDSKGSEYIPVHVSVSVSREPYDKFSAGLITADEYAEQVRREIHEQLSLQPPPRRA